MSNTLWTSEPDMSLNICPADCSVCSSSPWSSDTKAILIRLQPSLFRRPPISLFLLFYVFVLHPKHHYLDKLLTLPEKLNYINNSTTKILSSWNKHSSQKKPPCLHQATRAGSKLYLTVSLYFAETHPAVLLIILYLAKYFFPEIISGIFRISRFSSQRLKSGSTLVEIVHCRREVCPPMYVEQGIALIFNNTKLAFSVSLYGLLGKQCTCNKSYYPDHL